MLAAIGIDMDEQALVATGERIFNLTRLINGREGHDRRTDTLPPRFLEERTDNGWRLSQDAFDEMLDEYYDLRGWSAEGVPKEGRPRPGR
jgi:aldehyde:ferredoxin oxidoreductase